MSDPSAYLWLIPALPLMASGLTALLGPRIRRERSHWLCIAAVMASCVLSALVLVGIAQGTGESEVVKRYYTWFHVGNVDVGFTLRADALTAIMLVTVTFIGSLIAIYSSGYMHGDEGYARYFAEVALFIFAMTGLVLADNFLVLYGFWEGVGVCSYLLIGFWFTKPSAAAAVRKAFLVTRIGDLGFILGIILLWSGFGHVLDYDVVFKRVSEQAASHQTLLAAVCLLLFCGAVGKSAQFPLHVWLPDAMEGPSPVSALIHAATMVTAGVYMVARCMPMFREVPAALVIVSFIGAFTAFLAASIALTQNDLKRVLAYSTISQLGYMFLALGTGTSEELASLAVVAAIFHLFTHAFFKALLFLAAGSVMHSMGNVIDMRRFGGLRHVLKTTHWTFLCGAASLAGIPLLSGFWSKDEILAATLTASEANHPYRGVYVFLFILALITAFMTAFYTFRAYFMTFWGEERIPHEAGHHAHESPAVMCIPLIILAVFAVGIGIAVEPFTHWFSNFLGRTPGLGMIHEHEMNPVLMLGSSVFALAGVGLAWWMYVRRPESAGRFTQGFQWLYHLSANKFHLDELYQGLVVKPLGGLAEFCRVIDSHVIDGLVDLVGQVPSLLGQVLLRPTQNGLVQFYGLAMVFGLTVFIIVLVIVQALAG